MAAHSRYAPLETYLRESGRAEIPMTFENIEEVIGGHVTAKRSEASCVVVEQLDEQPHDAGLARRGVRVGERRHGERHTRVPKGRPGRGLVRDRTLGRRRDVSKRSR